MAEVVLNFRELFFFFRNKFIYRKVFKKEFEKLARILFLICSKRLCILRLYENDLSAGNGGHVVSNKVYIKFQFGLAERNLTALRSKNTPVPKTVL